MEPGKKQKTRRVVKIAAMIMIAVLGFWAGIEYQIHQTTARGFCVREKVSEYPLINPLLGCEIAAGDFSELEPIKSEIEKLISERKQHGVLVASLS